MERGDGKKAFPYTLIILAGGSSRRMKQDKALLPVADGTLIEYILQKLQGYFVDTLLSVSDPSKLQFLEQKIVVDEKPDCGPMMGIKTALAFSQTEKSFAIACDIPVFPSDLLVEILCAGKNHEIVVPVAADGHIEPLFALYSKSVQPRMEQLLNNGVRSLLPLMDRRNTHFIQMESDSLQNLNTRQDYKAFIRQL
ncbi:MAG: molybdenum cofactor guanylyltransferase [Candidatus Aminicenantes bacterium]|jgi:molybdopterin-guanine dinucleotide biosynthesis protein A